MRPGINSDSCNKDMYIRVLEDAHIVRLSDGAEDERVAVRGKVFKLLNV